MGVHEHHHAPSAGVRCAVLTLSDTRTVENDVGGALLRERLETAGHIIVDYRILRDEPALVRAHVEALAARGDTQAILTTGGTGITARDATFEALDGLLEKRLTGFGELFRMLSFQEIGPAAMLSRALAGTYRGLVIAALPGSPAAVQLAMDKLLLPELAHMVWLASPTTPTAHTHTDAHAPAAPSLDPGVLVKDAAGLARFDSAKMQKVALFGTTHFFCDVYGLAPGQAQKPHAHDDADKVYFVVSGQGAFQLGADTLTVGVGHAVHAPARVVHGVRNDGGEPLVLLVFMAPNPTPK